MSVKKICSARVNMIFFNPKNDSNKSHPRTSMILLGIYSNFPRLKSYLHVRNRILTDHVYFKRTFTDWKTGVARRLFKSGHIVQGEGSRTAKGLSGLWAPGGFGRGTVFFQPLTLPTSIISEASVLLCFSSNFLQNRMVIYCFKIRRETWNCHSIPYWWQIWLYIQNIYLKFTSEDPWLLQQLPNCGF